MFGFYFIIVAQSQKIARDVHEEISFRVLAANKKLDSLTMLGFRKNHPGALASLSAQVLEPGQNAGLVKRGNVAP